MDKPNLEFGSDNLQDISANLTTVYLRVKGGTLGDDEYRHTSLYCSIADADIIDLFARHEGNKRIATTVLLCAGFSLIHSKLDEFPVPLYDISQVFSRISLIGDIHYALMEETTLDIFVHNKYQTYVKRINIYIPEKLWNMIYGISISLKIRFSSFILYLLRTGIVEYNNFVSHFSRMHIDVPYEYEYTAEKWKKAFEESVAVKYNDLLSRIKYLYNTYEDILNDGHQDLKEEMKRIIDKST